MKAPVVHKKRRELVWSEEQGICGNMERRASTPYSYCHCHWTSCSSFPCLGIHVAINSETKELFVLCSVQPGTNNGNLFPFPNSDTAIPTTYYTGLLRASTVPHYTSGHPSPFSQNGYTSDAPCLWHLLSRGFVASQHVYY